MDEELIPMGSVLIEEEDWFAGTADAGSGAGGLDLHEGDQAVDFGFLRGQFGEDTAEAEGVFAKGGADEVVSGGGGVPLVEDEVEDFEDRGEAGGEFGAARDFEGDVFFGEGAFGADDALRDGGFGSEEGAGDLRSGKAAEQTEGEGAAGLGGASCARSSARPTSRVRRVSPAMTRADSMRQTASMVRCRARCEACCGSSGGSVADTATDHTSFNP
jgi:hypothetical protein